MEAALAQRIAAAQAAAQAAQADVQVARQQQQAQQAQQQTAAPRQSARGPGIDGRSIEKPKRFIYQDVGIEDRELPEWRFTFTSWLRGAGPDLQRGYGQPRHPDQDRRRHGRAEMKVRSIALYRVLTGLMTRRLLKLVRNTPRQNGYEAWRQTLALMMPQDRGRSLGVLQHLMSAEPWRGDKDQWEKVLQWETDVDRYEKSSGRPFPEELKVASVLKYAPREVRPPLSFRVTSHVHYVQFLAEYVDMGGGQAEDRRHLRCMAQVYMKLVSQGRLFAIVSS